MNSLLVLLGLVSIAVAGEKPVWREWYTFTRGGQPSGFYIENFHRKPGLLVIEQVIVERGPSGLIETFVHSEAKDNESLSPASFYVKKRQARTVDVYEAIVNESEIGFRIHVGQDNKIPITTLEPIRKNAIFGSFVPQFLAKIGPNKTQQKLTFESLLEEGEEGKFPFAKMEAEPVQTQMRIGKENCREYKLTFNGIPATWWVTSAGKLCRMLIPSLGSELKISSEAEARKFL
jgi:hypothetical protein